MTTILTIIHIIVSLFLVIIVLLQQGKGADMGAAFGGSSSQSVFGAGGPVPLLNKVTTGAAVIFMTTSITLAYLSAHKSTSSVMEDISIQKPLESVIERSAEPLPDQPLIPADTVEKIAPAEETSVDLEIPAEAEVTKENIQGNQPAPIEENAIDQLIPENKE